MSLKLEGTGYPRHMVILLYCHNSVACGRCHTSGFEDYFRTVTNPTPTIYEYIHAGSVKLSRGWRRSGCLKSNSFRWTFLEKSCDVGVAWALARWRWSGHTTNDTSPPLIESHAAGGPPAVSGDRCHVDRDDPSRTGDDTHLVIITRRLSPQVSMPFQLTVIDSAPSYTLSSTRHLHGLSLASEWISVLCHTSDRHHVLS